MMKFYFKTIDEAMDELEAEGIERYCLLDVEQKQAHIKDVGEYTVDFLDDCINQVKDSLAKTEEYNGERFVLCSGFTPTVVGRYN